MSCWHSQQDRCCTMFRAFLFAHYCPVIFKHLLNCKIRVSLMSLCYFNPLAKVEELIRCNVCNFVICRAVSGTTTKFPFVFFGRLRKLTRLWNWIGRQTTVIKDWFWWGGVRGLWKLLLGCLQGFFQDQKAMLQANVKLETQFNLPHRPTATHSAKVSHQDWFP